MATYHKIGDKALATTAHAGQVGNKNAQNAFKIFWNKPMSAQPRLEAWDSAADLTAGAAPSDEILAGTASSGNKSWLGVADTGAALPGANWYGSADERIAGTSPALIQGVSKYMLLDSLTVGVVSRLFNLALKVPSDAAQSGTIQHTPVIALRYYYTGSAPTISWRYNSSTNATPIWTTIAAGSVGYTLHFTGPDTVTATLDPFTKPAALTEVDEYWLQTA